MAKLVSFLSFVGILFLLILDVGYTIFTWQYWVVAALLIIHGQAERHFYD